MKTTFKHGLWAAALLFVGDLGTATAATIQFTTETGTAMVTEYGIRDDTSTRGVDLENALVTVDYVGGGSEVLVWQTLGRHYEGEAVGTGAYLYMNNHGFELAATSAIASLEFDLIPANSVFDITTAGPGNSANTDTSGHGFAFEIYAGGDSLTGIIDVTYSGIVSLGDAEAVGDLFTTKFVDFTGLTSGGFIGDLSFRTDMDTLLVAGDLVPAVPLPASGLLLLAGVAGFGLVRRKR